MARPAVPTARSTNQRTTSKRSRRSCAKNPDHVEAIEMLLDRPKDWSTDALDELQKKLIAAPQRFTTEQPPKGAQASVRHGVG